MRAGKGAPTVTHADSAYDSVELAEVYDAIYADVDDAPFWLSMATRGGADGILELGCGSGRVLVPLVSAGYDVTGLDLSAFMIDRCRATLAQLPADVQGRAHLVVGDMTSFDMGRTFGEIIVAFNTFHHLGTAAEQLACLRCCRDHLAPGGTLVLDLFNPDPAPEPVTEGAGASAEEGRRSATEATNEAPAPNSDDGAVVTPWTNGRLIRRWMSRCDYNRSEQRNECEMTYEIVEPDGSTRRLSERFPMRLIYRYELEHLLARSGFELIELYGGYEGESFVDGSVGMIAVARRTG